MTLPRLELLAALLAAVLAVVVAQALRIEKSQIRCWTDSSVALDWIKANPSRWKTFVANRVDKIQQLVCFRLYFPLIYFFPTLALPCMFSSYLS